MPDLRLELCSFYEELIAEESSDLQLKIYRMENAGNKFMNLPEYYALLASLYSAVGAYNKAETAYDKTIELSSEEKYFYLFNRACFYMDNQNYQKAIMDFAEVLELAIALKKKESYLQHVKQCLFKAKKQLGCY